MTSTLRREGCCCCLLLREGSPWQHHCLHCLLPLFCLGALGLTGDNVHGGGHTGYRVMAELIISLMMVTMQVRGTLSR